MGGNGGLTAAAAFGFDGLGLELEMGSGSCHMLRRNV